MVFGTECCRAGPDMTRSPLSKPASSYATTATEFSYSKRSPGQRDNRDDVTVEATCSGPRLRQHSQRNRSGTRRIGGLGSRGSKELSLWDNQELPLSMNSRDLTLDLRYPPDPSRKVDPCWKMYSPLPRGIPSQVNVDGVYSKASSVSESLGSFAGDDSESEEDESEGDDSSENDSSEEDESKEDDESDEEDDDEDDEEEESRIDENMKESSPPRAEGGILDRIFGRHQRTTKSSSIQSFASIEASTFSDHEDTTESGEDVQDVRPPKELLDPKPSRVYNRSCPPANSAEAAAVPELAKRSNVLPGFWFGEDRKDAEAEHTEEEDMESNSFTEATSKRELQVSLPTTTTTPSSSLVVPSSSMNDNSRFITNFGSGFFDMWGTQHPWVQSENEVLADSRNDKEASLLLSAGSGTQNAFLSKADANNTEVNAVLHEIEDRALIQNPSLRSSEQNRKIDTGITETKVDEGKRGVGRFFGRQRSDFTQGSTSKTSNSLPRKQRGLKLLIACRPGGNSRAKEEASLEGQILVKRSYTTCSWKTGEDLETNEKVNLEQRDLKLAVDAVQSEYKARTAAMEKRRAESLTAEESLLLESWRKSKNGYSSNSAHSPMSRTLDAKTRIQGTATATTTASGSESSIPSNLYVSSSSGVDARGFASANSIHSKSTCTSVSRSMELEATPRTSLLAASSRPPCRETATPTASNRSNRWSRSSTQIRFGAKQDDKSGSNVAQEKGLGTIPANSKTLGTRLKQAEEETVSTKKCIVDPRSATISASHDSYPALFDKTSFLSSNVSHDGEERGEQNPRSRWAPIETVRSTLPQIYSNTSSQSKRSAGYVGSSPMLKRLSTPELPPENVATSFDIAMQSYDRRNPPTEVAEESSENERTTAEIYTSRLSQISPEDPRVTRNGVVAWNLGDNPLRSKNDNSRFGSSSPRLAALGDIEESEEERRTAAYREKLSVARLEAIIPETNVYNGFLWGSSSDDEDTDDSAYASSISLDAYSA